MFKYPWVTVLPQKHVNGQGSQSLSLGESHWLQVLHTINLGKSQSLNRQGDLTATETGLALWSSTRCASDMMPDEEKKKKLWKFHFQVDQIMKN